MKPTQPSPTGRATDWIRSAIATIYATGMIYAGGAKFLRLSALPYGRATALFIIARREQKKIAFTLVEGLLFGAILQPSGSTIWRLALFRSSEL